MQSQQNLAELLPYLIDVSEIKLFTCILFVQVNYIWSVKVSEDILPQKSSRASLPLSHLRVECRALLVPRRVAAVPVERTRRRRRRRLWAAASLVTVPRSWSSPRWRHIWRLHSSTKPMKLCYKLEEQYFLITKFYALDIRTLFSPIPWSLEPKRLVHAALFARLEDVHHLHWAHLSSLYFWSGLPVRSRLRKSFQAAL